MLRRCLVRTTIALLCVALAGCGGDGKRADATARTDTIAFTSLAPEVYEPCGIGGVAGAVWVIGCSGRMVRLTDDGRTATGTRLAGGISALRALAADGKDGLWALETTGEGPSLRGRIVRLHAGSGERAETTALGRSVASQAVYAFGRLWVAALDGRLFSVEDGRAREVDKEQPLLGVVADGDALWTIAENGTVTKRSGSGSAVRTYSGVNPHAIAAAAGLGSVWLASNAGGVTRLDPSTGAVTKVGVSGTKVGVSGTVNDIVPCAGSMWLSQPDTGLGAVDAGGNEVRSVRLTVGPHYLLCAGDRLWVLSEDGRVGSIAART